MWCLQHPKIEPHEVFLPQPAKTTHGQLFSFWSKKIGTPKDVLKFY